jgi:hypothetical protein
MDFNGTRAIDEIVAMNKKAVSLLSASLFVLTIFVGHVSAVGEDGQQMSSHPTTLAEGSGLSGASDNLASLSELRQNGSYKSTSAATSVPHAGGIGMLAPDGSKPQYDLITFVNCSFVIWYRFQNNDSNYYANKPAELYRWNPPSSQWKKIRDSTTNADGRVEFLGLTESKQGVYYYTVAVGGIIARLSKLSQHTPLSSSTAGADPALKRSGYIRGRGLT